MWITTLNSSSTSSTNKNNYSPHRTQELETQIDISKRQGRPNVQGFRSITLKKPYKKKISYDVLGGEVSYDRYSAWMRKKFKDGRFRKGYMQVNKGTYLEELVIWKNRDK